MKFRTQRYPTRFPVVVTAGAAANKSTITSISASGACIAVDPAPAAGQACTLECAGLRIRGSVKWSSKGRAGIKFDRDLARPDLERIRFGVSAAHSPRKRQVGFGGLR